MSDALDVPSSASPPQQARSRETLERLLDAAQGLLQERGLSGLSIPEVVRRARSSTGSFYARFKDKDALLRAVEERWLAGLERFLDEFFDPERWRDVPTSRIVTRCIDLMLDTVDRHASMIRAFAVRSAGKPQFEAEVARIRRDVVDGFRRLMLSRRGEMSHPEPAVAIDFALEAAFAFMQSRILTGGQPLIAGRPDDARTRRELTRLFLVYVGIAPTDPEDPDS